MTEELQNKTLFDELLEEYDEKVIALAQHLGLELAITESDYELDPTEEFETEEEKEERLQELKEEKEEAIQNIKDNLNNITETSWGSFDYYGDEYLVLTDDEADSTMEDALDNYIDECIIPEIPDAWANYFDSEAWKRDARMDGRGHILNRYDGTEYEEKVNGTWYYIYRQ